MTCSPEQSRINGAKSRGAITPRGKSIASRNARKHGLLSEQPPLLACEDLETFQGLVQSLVSQYDPQSPIEHLLIQKVAMGWQRLHRLWGAEAAIATLEMLKRERKVKYPQEHRFDLEDAGQFDRRTLKREIHCLQKLSAQLEDLEWMLPKKNKRDWDGADNWLTQVKRILDAAIESYPREAIPPEIDGERDSHELTYQTFWGKLATRYFAFETCLKYNTAHSRDDLKEFMQLIGDRVSELESMLADQARLDAAQAEASIAAQAIPQNIDLLTRYERHIWQGLTDAIDRLEQIQQRLLEAPTGSFSGKSC